MDRVESDMGWDGCWWDCIIKRISAARGLRCLSMVMRIEAGGGLVRVMRALDAARRGKKSVTDGGLERE